MSCAVQAAHLNFCSVFAATSFAASTKPQHNPLSAQEFPFPQDLKSPKWIQAPLSLQQRSAYRSSIGGKWKWSEALPELQYYYETYGFGVTSMHTTLQWSDGAIQAYESPKQQEQSGTCTPFSVQYLLIMHQANAFLFKQWQACLVVMLNECQHAFLDAYDVQTS